MSRPQPAHAPNAIASISTAFSTGPFRLSSEAITWVRESFEALSLWQKLGQLVMPMALDRSARTLDHFAALGVGGVFFFHAKASETAAAADRLQSSANTPLLIAGDLEFGELSPVGDFTFTNQMGVAATGRRLWAERMGRAAARAGKLAGYNWMLSPVVDLDLNPQNPVVNTRSFGADPEVVASFGAAFIEGAQAEGVAACAKHWPGDGVDYRDQHLVTSLNTLDEAEWRNTYGKVYRAAIDSGVMTIMSSHIALPRLGPERDVGASDPASLRPWLNHGLLRADLGFQGLVVSDATTMAGFGAHGGRADTLPRCVGAGCDLLLFTPEAELDMAHLERAVHDGRLSQHRVDEAVLRVLGLKAALGMHLMGSEVTSPREQDAEIADWAIECARASITLVRNEDGLLPLSPTRRRLLLVEDTSRSGPFALLPTLKVFDLLVAAGFDVVRFEATTHVAPGLFDAIIYAVGNEAALCRSSLRMDWVALHKTTIRAMERFWHAAPALILSFGNPYLAADAPECKAVVNAYSAAPEAQVAAIEAILGRIPFQGVSPVDPWAQLKSSALR